MRYLKQQEVSEQEWLQQLQENAHNQEAKLRRVRALRGQVEHKRLSNSKLGECHRWVVSSPNKSKFLNFKSHDQTQEVT